MRPFKKLCLALLVSVSPRIACAGDIELQVDGLGKIGDEITFSAIHFSDKWCGSTLSGKGYQPVCRERNGIRQYQGSCDLRESSLAPELRIDEETVAPGSLKLRYTLTTGQALPSAELSLQFLLPAHTFAGKTVAVDGKPFPLPAKRQRKNMAKYPKAHTIEVPLEKQLLTIQLDSPSRVLLSDGRFWGNNRFGLRIEFPGCAYPIAKPQSIGLTLSLSPYRCSAVDIAPVANMGFADETANDGKGGWTDQGADNDLSQLRPGTLAAPPGEFNIADPAKHSGKSCIVLGGGGRPHFPRAAEIPLAGRTPRTLLLLHASAWCPKAGQAIGTVEAVYTDGSVQNYPVKSGVDIGNWWGDESFDNAAAAWKGHNGKANLALYMSCFSLSGKPVRSVRLNSNGTAVWMVAGVSTSEQRLFVPRPVTFIHKPSADWRVIENRREILPGSALDFSFLLDAPAGKHGFIQIRDGHFQFDRQSRPTRFYGVNLCMEANFLDKNRADLLAERLARCGYNAVRLHHFDNNRYRSKNDSATFLPQPLDQLDYLVHALKERGLYVTLDLFTNYHARKGEFPAHPGLGSGVRDYKLAAMLLPAVNAHLKAFAKNLLTHRNPYTNLRWLDDPALVFISLINENTIYHIIDHGTGQTIRNLYREAFDAYAVRNGIAVTERDRDREFRRFLALIYQDYYQDMAAYLRNLGLKVPLSEQNFISAPLITGQRAKLYDYVDNHCYWDHPTYPGKEWSLPTKTHNHSVVGKQFPSPCEIAPTRVFGKPFTITEFDFCRVNPYRANGAPTFAAYCAYQDFDAIFRFAYSHSKWTLFDKDDLSGPFDAVNDPIKLLSERLGMALFARRDVRVASESFAVAVAGDDFGGYSPRYPTAAQQLTLRGKVGSVLYEANKTFYPPLPADTQAIYSLTPRLASENSPYPLLPSEPVSADRTVSSTGELTADFKQETFSAVTPRSEVLVLPPKQKLAGKFLSATGVRGFSVLGAVAIDSNELASSKRILLLHLSDAAQAGAEYSTPERNLLLKKGDGSVMARRSVSDIALAVPQDDWTLHALDMAGKRLGPVDLVRQGANVSFRADNFAFPEVVFAYELTRQ
jgi:hypothetical protein